MRPSLLIPWILLFGLIGYLGWKEFAPVSPVTSSTTGPTVVVGEPGVPGPGSYASAVRAAAPAVVNIFTKQAATRAPHPFFDHPFGLPKDGLSPDQSSLGSGVIVSADGFVLTNNHVIQEADRIVVALTDGREAEAQVVGTDPDTDLALLKIDLTDLPALAFKETAPVVGDVVLAIGNPFGVGQTVTQGIVSALGRSGLGINTYEDFIQTDAAINPGNSGGALIDARGHLLGINTAIFSRSGGNMGIGFAIPASLARQVMTALQTEGVVRRGWLGVEIAGKDRGEVFVAGILKAGPAQAAGLQAGDQLNVVHGVPVQSPQQVIAQIATLTPGQTIELQVTRAGAQKTLSVTLGERPVKRLSR